MAEETTRSSKVISWGAGIVATLLGLWLWDTYQKHPHLELAGDIDVYPDKTLITLRTRSSVPVAVRYFYYLIRPTDQPCCASIDESEPLVVDTTGLYANTWYTQNITDLQAKPDEIFALPIKLYDAHPEKVKMELIICYGETNPPQQLRISDVTVTLNDRNSR